MKKISEHKLPTNDIIVRQDSNSTLETIESNYGLTYPLIRLRDVSFSNADVQYFSLNFDIDSLLPRVYIEINDKDFNQRDANLVEQGDTITVFVGNAMDDVHKPIKNNYYVESASVDDQTGTYTINAFLDVKDMFYSQNRVFVNKSSLEVFEFIANECGLGFVTNVQITNDSMNWIQHQTNADFIHYLKGRTFINNDTKVEVFVDQFANLNVVDIREALTAPSTTTFVTDIFGKPLEKDSVFKMTNYQHGVDVEKDRRALLDGFAPTAKTGSFDKHFAQTLNVQELWMEDSEAYNEVVNSNQQRLMSTSSYTAFVNSNTYQQYDYAKQLNGNFNNQLYDKLTITASTTNYYPQLYMFLGVHIDLYDAEKIAVVDSQDQEVNSDNFNEKVETDDKSSKFAQLNERYTGDYVVIGMSYSYRYNQTVKRGVLQSLKLIKR